MQDEPHDQGLAFDLAALVSRRRALTLLAGAALATIGACSGSNGSDDSTSGPGRGSATTASSASDRAATGVAPIPEETAGPFPGDGSNGPDALGEEGIVREDIRSSIGAASGTAAGVPLTIELTLLRDGAPLAGAAVYAWHCDAEGRYSMYSDGATDENYLRGVQAAGSDGTLRFTSIFPGAYAGRWPHVHFEVYESVDAATTGGTRLVTSQLALPQEACELVYAGSGYPQSARNLARTSLTTDTVFSDGWDAQLAEVAGTVATGFAASLPVAV